MNKEIKFGISLTGLPKISSQIGGVSAEYRKMTLSIQQMRERNALQMQRIDKKEADEKIKLNDRVFKDQQEKLRQGLALEEKYSRQRQQIRDREALSVKHSIERQKLDEETGGSLGLKQYGALARAGGLSNLGRVGRGISAISGGGFSIGETVALGAAFAGVVVAAKGLEFVFGKVTETIGAVLGAIGSIGKARGFQEMLEESASDETTSNIARMTVSPEQRASKEALDAWAASMAGNPAYGGHTKAEWLKGAGVAGTATGLQRDLINNKSLNDQLGMMGHLGGVTPSQIYGSYSGIWNQNRNLSQDQVLDIMRSGVGMGREGQFNIQDLATGGGKILSMPGTFMGGNYVSNTKSALAYGAIIKGKTPEASLESAGTEANAFFRELLQPKHRAAAKKLGAQFDNNGKLLNPDEVVAYAATHQLEATKLIPQLGGRESGPFMSHMATGIEGAKTGMGNDELNKLLLEQIERYKALSVSQEQLNQENQDAIGVEDQFKAAFNRLASSLEPGFLKLLASLQPDVDMFAKMFADNSEQLEKLLKDFVNVLEDLVPRLGTVVQAIIFGLNGGDEKDPLISDIQNIKKDIQNTTTMKRVYQGAGWTQEEFNQAVEQWANRFNNKDGNQVEHKDPIEYDRRHMAEWIAQNPQSAQKWITQFREDQKMAPEDKKTTDDHTKALQEHTKALKQDTRHISRGGRT